MRFRRWPRPTPFTDTSRKRAAFHRKQRLEREALPLFAGQIAGSQHGVEEEMRMRAETWNHTQAIQRHQRAAKWREARTLLFELDAVWRRTIRTAWKDCPYPADPSYFADFLHSILVGKIDPCRPPWKFHQEITPRTTPNPATFSEAFRQIGGCKVGGGPKTTPPMNFCSAGI